MPIKIEWNKLPAIVILLLVICYLSILATGKLSLSRNIPTHPESTKVLVIANQNSPASLRIAQYYIQRRGIPRENFLTLDLPDSTLLPFFESVTYPAYQEMVEQPIRRFLERNQLVNQIRYIVLTRGVPLRIKQVPYPLVEGHPSAQDQSIDSTLAALDYKSAPFGIKDPDYKRMTGKEIYGMLTPNLYWRQTYPFDHRLTGGYLVTRLDGFTEADARTLVDRALSPRPSLKGTVLLDPVNNNESSDANQIVDIFDPEVCTPKVIPHCVPHPAAMVEASGRDVNNDLRISTQQLRSSFPQLQVLSAPPNTFAKATNLFGYMSWGSNDSSFDPKTYHSLRFLPGAIADTVVSSSGRTFFPTKTGQSLIGDLIAAAEGVTGVRGYVDEPELQGMGSATILFDRYFKGSNLATAYYQSMRFVGWRTIILGDPLATAAFTP